MLIYLATWPEVGQKRSLDKLGQVARLLSYFFIKSEKQGWVEAYVTKQNGLPNSPQPTKTRA
jgi:hypothetical protein